MKTAEDLRARAERCMRWARAATDRTVARKFEDLARAYRQMADEFDRRPMLRFMLCTPAAGECARHGAPARSAATDDAEPALPQTSSGRST
jgi:hypothetical protein